MCSNYKDIMENDITQIQRYPSRSMEVQRKTLGKTPDVNIINSYSPDMIYGEESHNKHWAETREITKQIPLKNVI